MSKNQKRKVKPRVSVLTLTNRPNSLSLARKSLNRQTFKDFEWIIVSPLRLDIAEAKVIPDPPKRKGDYWQLNRAYNEGLKHCRGELVVSLQDWIYITPQGLEKFWLAYEQTDGCISGIGDQYDALIGAQPTNKVWVDPRRTDKYGSFYECMPNDWELNWACAPLKAFYDIGGFDEELDKWAGGDNISVCERMDELGYKFYLDQTNESFTLRHGRYKDWDERHCLFSGEYQKRKKYLIDRGVWPKLTYLTKRDIK